MTTGRPRDLVGRPLAGLGGVQGPRGPALLGQMGLRADWIAQGGGFAGLVHQFWSRPAEGPRGAAGVPVKPSCLVQPTLEAKVQALTRLDQNCQWSLRREASQSRGIQCLFQSTHVALRGRTEARVEGSGGWRPADLSLFLPHALRPSSETWHSKQWSMLTFCL